ncbi:alpha/beta fold hydrolase [Rhodospirillum centenum]|uniref:Hydrolase, alpha n=1 Tax=Rhodospirillum centenum (strain ATCC 51521 / SW) TaxID=414684 RepID=B6ISH1_RHOCS|nr:alpha/beta hydrolase [Rhodospirillum centenum]ACI98407.1 hydrolase, alpha [Rhodospirillum centenum SW]
MIRPFLVLLLLLFSSALAPPAGAAFKSDRISVSVRGSGPDVVLIPGLSSSPEVWEGTVEAIPGYRYHLIQVAGFAGAPVGANAEGPVVAPVAEEIARYITESGLDRPALIGHSLGGLWAMMVAARHPETASRVMVVDMLPYLGALYAPPGTPPEGVQAIAAQIREGLLKSSDADRKARIEATIATMVREEGMRARPVAHSLASDRAVSAQAMYELIVTDLRPELPAIQGPLTVLWVRAPNSPLTEEQLAGAYRALYATAPAVTLTRIPDAYHFIMFDQPGTFQREVRAFLKGE